MNALLGSLKADLLGRRLLPLLVVLGVAFLGAIAYAVLGGGSSSSSSSATPAGSLGASLPVVPPSLASPAPSNPHRAVAETTSGTSYQRGGSAHNPFVKLPEPKAKASASTGSSASTPASAGKGTSGGATTGGSGATTGGSGGSGGSTPSGPSNKNPTTPSKKKVLQRTYQVALLFGLAPPPGQNPQLTPFEDLKRLQPLPSKEHPLIVYSGVSSSGEGAIFTLLHEAIVKGGGVCLPSPTQCEMIDMPVGKTEELQYVGSEGQAVTYLLQVVSIVKHEVTSTPVSAAAKVSKVGRKLLRAAGLPAVAQLRYLPSRGVVVFIRHHPH